MKYQRQALEKFPFQIEYAVKNYKKHHLKEREYGNIVLCGLGGSGIANYIVKSYFFNKLKLPIEVVSDYFLPAYVNKDSIVILNSYSGNTEETLSAYKDAVTQNAKVIVLTTGGQLLDLARKDNQLFYLAEEGYQPRMALGYSLAYLMLIISELNGVDFRDEMKDLAGTLKNVERYITRAERIFDLIKEDIGKKIIVVTDTITAPIGLRFTQQVNENAKEEAYMLQLPEVNHNVIETYYEFNKLESIFVFLNSGLSKRVGYRFDFLEQLLKDQKQNVVHIAPEWFMMDDILELIYTLDWLSLLIADARNMKSDEIHNINKLKEFLASK
jgi:glucose/mannose-6-phosphate isomerase